MLALRKKKGIYEKIRALPDLFSRNGKQRGITGNKEVVMVSENQKLFKF
jgi:hypothetical protein